jgi:5'-3' exonuclease
LNKDNEVLLVKVLIKEYGGLEELVKEADNDKLEGLTEDEVIEYLTKERFYSTLIDLCKNSDLVQDIKQTYVDHASSAHQEENYKDLVNEFDNIVVVVYVNVSPVMSGFSRSSRLLDNKEQPQYPEHAAGLKVCIGRVNFKKYV